jgi:hypothetical protein
MGARVPTAGVVIAGHRPASPADRPRGLGRSMDDGESPMPRHTTGCRCGARLEWTSCRTPAHVARFSLLVGLAAVLWAAVGQAVPSTAPQARLLWRRGGQRLSPRRVSIPVVALRALLGDIDVPGIRASLLPPQPRCLPGRHAPGQYHERAQRSGCGVSVPTKTSPPSNRQLCLGESLALPQQFFPLKI